MVTGPSRVSLVRLLPEGLDCSLRICLLSESCREDERADEALREGQEQTILDVKILHQVFLLSRITNYVMRRSNSHKDNRLLRPDFLD
jgi:hypothetical protein